MDAAGPLDEVEVHVVENVFLHSFESFLDAREPFEWSGAGAGFLLRCSWSLVYHRKRCQGRTARQVVISGVLSEDCGPAAWRWRR